MMRFYFFINVLLILSHGIFAQKIQLIEHQLTARSEERLAVQKNLDSLKIELDEYAKKIEQEKSQGTVSERKISAWFKEIYMLTRQISAQEKIAQNLQKEIQTIQFQLDGLYAAVIDSLQEVAEKTRDSRQLAEVNSLLIDYTHKRLALMPTFTSFSFDPARISRLSLQNAGDSLEYAIYLEYLLQARNEVVSIISTIENNGKEIDELLWLQERSNRFIEQIEQNRPLTFFTPSGGTTPGDLQTYAGREASSDPNVFLHAQAQSLYHLINQLSGSDLAGFSAFTIMNSGQNFFSLKDYRKFLQQAEKLLKNYERLLTQKIESK